MRTGHRSLTHWLVGAAVAAISMTGAWLSPERAYANDITHVVVNGQTLGHLAKRYGTTVEALRAANQLRPGERLRAGRLLVIPAAAAERSKPRQASPGVDRSARAKPTGADRTEPDRRGGGGATVPARVGTRAAAQRGNGGPTGSQRERWAQRPARAGYVRIAHGTERFEGQLVSRRGALVPAGLAGVTRMMRFSATGSAVAVDPRLARLIAMVSDHFGGKTIRIVSGYRPYVPTQYTPHSNHNFGRAIDLSVDGVPNTVLRDFCKGLRNAGVGYYPNSSFVHLDVRQEKAFWIDYSGPGEPPRYQLSPGADEAVQDVDRGSTETRHVVGQQPDSTGGIIGTTDPHGDAANSMGQSGPTIDRP